MFQSSLDVSLCRRIKGEAGESIIEYLDLSSGFIAPKDLLLLVKCIQMYQSTHSNSHSLIEIDLSSNQLCGVNSRGEGNYDAEAFTAFAAILQTSRVLKTLCLDRNFLSIPGCLAIGQLLANQNSLINLS
jgi:hypothetical protein